MTKFVEQLLERAAEYERKAIALRLAAHEMNGHAVEKKQAGAGALLDGAMRLRAEQQASVARPPSPGARGSYKAKQAAAAARRPLLQRLLAQAPAGLTLAEIQTALATGGDTISTSRISQMLRELHARKVGTGTWNIRWTLARKAAQVAATRPAKPRKATRPGTWRAAKTAAKRRSAALLARLSLDEPRPLTQAERAAAGGLLRHGYIVKQGDGFVRSAKEFTI